jgi:hypothetical protein
MASNIDIVPTLVDLLHLETPARFHGRSLLPFLDGRRKGAPRDIAFAVRAGDRYVLVSDEYTYHRMNSGEETIWDGAYSITHRVPAEGIPEDLLQRFRALAEEARSMETARAHRPLRVPDMPFLEIIDPSDFADPERMLTESSGGSPGELPEAARWAVYPHGVFNWGWAENAPPLELQVAVPNAEYAVQIEIYAGRIGGHPGSALAIRVENETEQRIVREMNGHGYRFVDLGTYTVDDGFFSVSLLPAADRVWAGVKRFRFAPKAVSSTTTESLNDIQQREDAIRALGYL